MERKIGEIFYDRNNEAIICVKASGHNCEDLDGNECKYYNKDCKSSNLEGSFCNPICSGDKRDDKTDVIFLNAE